MATLPFLEDLWRGIAGGLATRTFYGYLLIAAYLVVFPILSYLMLRWFGIVGPRRPDSK